MIKLYLLDSNDYNNSVFDTIKNLTSDYKRICIVTMNKTYSALYDSLEERGIDVSKFYFIDTVSPSLFKMIPTKNNCTFVNSIDDNSAFATTILDTVKLKKCDLLIFDSLSSVLVYKYDNELMSLMQYLVPFFKKLKIDVYLFALTEDRKRNAIKQVEMLVDKSVSSD